MSEPVRVVLGACRRHGRDSPDDSETVTALLGRNYRSLGLTKVASIAHAPSGFPVIAGSPLEVSVSHDAGCAVLATSTRRIGVDLQHVTTVSDRFRDRLRSRTHGAVSPWTDGDAVQSWVVREAIAKSRRRGLRDMPWRYTVDSGTSGTYQECRWVSTYIEQHEAWLAVAVAGTFDDLRLVSE